MSERARAFLMPVILITSLFFLWGMANNLNDILIKQFKKAFTLTDLQTGFVQSAFYMGYFLLALPAGLTMRRYGYKAAVVLGLVLYGIGALLFYPAAQAARYELFLLALFVIAAGLAFLETSANPLITVLGDPADSERRLNLAQAFNPLGAITGLLIGKYLILSGIEHSESTLSAMPAAERTAFYVRETQAVQGPYVAIGLFVLAWAAIVALTRFPPQADRPPASEAIGGRAITHVFRHPHLLAGVIAQFFYVGAQVGVWSYTIRYAQDATGIGERAAADWVIAATILFLVGRFVGTALMGRINPARLMAVFAGINVALAIVAAVVGGLPGLLALTAISFFMSIMFPTIFAIGVKGLGNDTSTGSALLVMAIIGGAVMTPVMGAISTYSSIQMAMLVPAVSFVIIAWFAIASMRRGVSTAAIRAAGAH
ncbi:L-fucose:H+ symporter permease [Sphingomonas sp. RS2018]